MCSVAEIIRLISIAVRLKLRFVGLVNARETLAIGRLTEL
jgi:hypothetical protein